MDLRAAHIVPLATVVLLACPAAPAASPQGAYTLRIESLSRSHINVRVTTTSVGSQGKSVPSRDTVLAPPSRSPIADSVGRIHIVVMGFESVRVTLTSMAVPSDSLVSEGRDITLSRTADGRFERVWTVQHLLP